VPTVLYKNKNNNSKKNCFFLSSSLFFFHSLFLLFHISFIHPIHLHSVILPVPFFPSVSFCHIHSICAQLSLSPHCSFGTFFPLLLAIIFLSFALSPPGTPKYSLSPLILSVVSGFFDSLPSFLLVCVFVPFIQLYIHPSSFCS
jgi:hypothetical protein